MTEEVLDLKPAILARQLAACICCSQEYHVPKARHWTPYTCPECDAVAVIRPFYYKPGPKLVCSCGCMFFQLTPLGEAYCIGCGKLGPIPGAPPEAVA